MINNKQKYSIIWLSCVCTLIITIVMVGGITRLTNSGLSMVNWHPIMGIIPPLSESSWQATFKKYQQFPEYQQLHQTMQLESFKWIFFWEYAHRMLGRLIGIAIIIPLLILSILKILDKKLIYRGFIMSGLVISQGIMGWIMVKSGLINQPYISHIRLMLHLSLAFFLFIYIWWTLLIIVKPICYPIKKSTTKWVKLLIFGIIIQIIYGAFVAGLDAGYIMNTFPKMGHQWVPNEIVQLRPIWNNLINNPITVQFIHRILAIILLLSVILISYSLLHQRLSWFQRRAVIFLLISTITQFALGIITLIYHVPIYIAVAHQLMALLLLTASVTIYFSVSNYNSEY